MPTSIPIQMLNRIYRRAYWRLTVGFSIFYVVVLAAGLSLLVSNPKVGSWISDAAQAEYVGDVPVAASETVRLALPNEPVRQAKAN
jgi:hypothetical protein